MRLFIIFNNQQVLIARSVDCANKKRVNYMAKKSWRTMRVAIPVALFTTLLVTGPALAHARIAGSVPENGAMLAEPPAEVRVRYTEVVEVRLSKLTLLDAEGRPVAGTKLAPEGDRELVLQLPPLPGGTYTVESQALAKDGHVFQETFQFTVAQTQPSPPDTPPAVVEPSPAAPASPAPVEAEPAPPAVAQAQAAGDGGGPARIGTGEAVLGAALLLAGGILLGSLARRKRR